MSQKIKAYKIVISGTYRTVKAGEYVDFENVTGYIPHCEKEYAEAMVRKRYAEMWLTLNKKNYPQRVKTVREVFIDSIQECEHTFSFYGKDVRELSYEELQDMAVFKGLRAVPLYKKGGLRQARATAYAAYSEHVLGKEIEGYKESNFALGDQEPILVTGDAESVTYDVITNEDVIEAEQQAVDTSKTAAENMSRADLEALAKKRSISFNPAISDAKLRAKLFT